MCHTCKPFTIQAAGNGVAVWECGKRLTACLLRQVEDCTRDVCELSTYHFRYRICNVHIRLPQFMRQGKLQRFCQQCGRCHELSEFEGNQRSCRAQLDRHNARRAPCLQTSFVPVSNCGGTT